MKFPKRLGELCVIKQTTSTFVHDRWLSTLYYGDVCVLLRIHRDDAYEHNVVYIAHVLSRHGLCHFYVNHINIARV